MLFQTEPPLWCPMEPHNITRKLVALLSADVQGYSRLMGDDEIATIRTLTAYRTLMTTLIQQYRGKVIDSPGDNLLAEFASALDGVQCAVAIQQELQTHNAKLPAHRQMAFRIGINVGDVVVEGERLYGDGVNIAARLEGLAEGGGICISGTVYDQVENKLPLGYEYLGEKTVKNIAKPIRVYRVVPDAAVEPVNPVETPAAAAATTPPQDKPSIAVLPFLNMSGDAEQEYFSDGITEDLLTALSKLSGLLVISRNSVFQYKGKAVKPKDVSRDLGVRYLLEGSVRKAGKRVRVTAQLIDATTGYHLWAERYDRDLDDIFALQDEVTEQIVSALAVQLTSGEQARLERKYTDNLEAYDYYLRADANFSSLTPERLAETRQLYEKAISLDPHFAAAYASLSTTYIIEWDLQWSEDPAALDRAADLAEKAKELDDSLPLAHRVLAGVYLFKKEHESALSAAQRALSLDPNDAAAYARLGLILNYLGQPDRTRRLVEQAMQLNPHYPAHYIFAIGHAEYLMGQYEAAIVTFKRAIARNPETPAPHAYLAAVHTTLGQRQEAQAEVAEVLRISPNYSIQAARERSLYKDEAILESHLTRLQEAGLH